MNQILLTENKNDKKKSNNKYKSNNNSADMKKIIMFFGIIILVFGITIIGIYSYKTLKNKKEQEVIIAKPHLALEETEESVTIIAKSETGIEKIIYTWNEEAPNEVQMNGRTSHEEKMEIPNGENTLKVKVIDQNGQENETSKSFSITRDTEEPIIETAIVENAKLKITATDETAMKYITYKWNEEEETRIDVEDQEDTFITTEIDVKRGKNTLVITAVDAANNTETIDKTFNGVNKPKIEVKKDGSKLFMKMTHDMGFEKIEFSVNGKIYVYDENFSGYNPTQKEIEYQFALKEGENTVIIVAISTEGTEAIYKGKCNYTAE